MEDSVWSIVVASGKGKRFGGKTPKQFIRIEGKPLFLRTVEALLEAFPFDGIIVTLPPGKERDRSILEHLAGNEKIILTSGGSTRTASVRCALRKLPERAKIVLVHDGVRPKVNGNLVHRVVSGAARFGACVPLLKPRDTVKEINDNGLVLRTLDRERLGLVQTPQGFRRELLEEAYKRCPRKSFYDDAAALENIGIKVHYVEGCPKNIKVTTPDDLEVIYSSLDIRVGQGYDVHRLVSGRPLVLCGVRVPSPKGQSAHSDGDVALHALMDAMLGAAALGDIGKHFPSTDKSLKGISSLVLLQRTKKILEKAGWKTYQTDITILLQEPKISPYLGEMRNTLSQALDIPPERVSIKAGTEEGLGITGKNQSVAAHAICVIRKF